MIRAYIGGVGSGKSISAVRFMVKRGVKTFVNFEVHVPFAERIKKDYIIQSNEIINEKSGKVVKTEKSVNWKFWKEAIKKYGGYDFVLDEVQQLVNARRAMSRESILLTMWFAQIRKIMGSTEQHEIVLISQRISKIDVAWRDLIHEVVITQKVEMKKRIPTRLWENGKIVTRLIPEIRIINFHFLGDSCLSNAEGHMMGMKCHSYKDWFVANSYMQYYDSYSIVEFGSDDYV